MTRTLLAAAAAMTAFAVPSVAHGATLHQDGSPHRLLLQDASGETNLVSVEGSRALVIRDSNAPIRLARVPACVRLDAYAVKCAAVRHLDVDLGPGPDVATVATPREVSLEGGAGNDRYVSLAVDAPSRVDFKGGVGLDVANYFFATAGVRVSVDLEAGDGRPGDDDRIRRDVESVFGSQFADVLAGSPRTVQLAGFDGDDVITGGTGAEALSGGDGNDLIDARDGAPDTVDCGGQALDRAMVDVGAEASITGCAYETGEDR
jgi:Ca2+-binding RTX toxin-like protein